VKTDVPLYGLGSLIGELGGYLGLLLGWSILSLMDLAVLGAKKVAKTI